jgi:hypothetical protein
MHIVFMDFILFLLETVIISLNSVNMLIFIMLKFERTESLNIIQTRFGFKGLRQVNFSK